MKKVLSSLGILGLILILLSNSSTRDDSYNARLNTYKHECKELLKPARYEGSRITHYTASKSKQTKSIETYLVLDSEYKFAFSGKESSSRVSVSFYESEKKRFLLKELKNISKRNVIVSSLELTANYRKKAPNSTERLKNLYIEYNINPTDVNHEALVFVMGYKR